MAIGRTFPESLQKALRSLEQGRLGLNADPAEAELASLADADLLAADRRRRRPDRIFQIGELLRRGVTVEAIHDACRIDLWFLDQMLAIVEERHDLEALGGPDGARRAGRGGGPSGSGSPTPSSPTCGASTRPTVRAARAGRRRPPDVQDGRHVRRRVRRRHAVPLLDVGGRERGRGRRTGRASSSSARARTASARASSSTTAACTPASPCARPGYETVMLNCNPETVSTDYDTSDRLYFEPLTRRGRAQRDRRRDRRRRGQCRRR